MHSDFHESVVSYNNESGNNSSRYQSRTTYEEQREDISHVSDNSTTSVSSWRKQTQQQLTRMTRTPPKKPDAINFHFNETLEDKSVTSHQSYITFSSLNTEKLDRILTTGLTVTTSPSLLTFRSTHAPSTPIEKLTPRALDPPPRRPPPHPSPTNSIGPLTTPTPSTISYKAITPPRKLRELLSLLRTTPSGSRRMNACGALKTLAAIPANRVRLCRTIGLPSTLAHVLNDEMSSATERQRSITALLHLAFPEKNRALLYGSGGVAAAIMNALRCTDVKTKHMASHTISLLSKCEDIKAAIGGDRGMIEAMCEVVESYKPGVGFVSRVVENNETNVSDATGTDATCDVEVEATRVNRTKADSMSKSARLCILTSFLHLAKVKDVAYIFTRTQSLTSILIRKSNNMEQAANSITIAIFAELSRHPKNNLSLVYQTTHFVPSLVIAASSSNSESRKYACFAIQNLACDTGCRQELATTPNLLATLAACANRPDALDESIAAIAALRSIGEDPSNFIYLANTQGCFEMLTQLAARGDNGRVQYEACDVLATLSHWIVASAMTGMALNENETMEGPELRVHPWNQWQ